MVRLILFLYLLFNTHLAIGDVSVQVDRTVLSINESLSMEIIQTGNRGGKPDLSVLKKNFDILSQSQSQQFNMINGQTSRKNIWSINLMPKRTGEIIIPPIKVGAEYSKSLSILIQNIKTRLLSFLLAWVK